MGTQITPPTPGTTSAANAYQMTFNAAYYASKPPAFQSLYNGRPGSADAAATPLTQDQVWTLVGQLIAQGWIVDEEIDAEGMDPYTTMFMRELYGQTWEPGGLGATTGSTEVDTPGEFSGAVTSAAVAAQPWLVTTSSGETGILVSTLLSDYPAYPVPAASTVVTPPTPQVADPVGIRIIPQVPSQPNYVGDVFRCAVANDGYAIGDTWMGTSGAFTGTWTKEALEAGIMIVWVKTA